VTLPVFRDVHLTVRAALVLCGLALGPSLAAPLPPAAPAADLLTIESDLQQADNRTGVITATGNVRIVSEARGLTVRARQAQFFSREGRLVLSGDVEALDAQGQRIRAERLVYLVNGERLVAQPVEGGQVTTRFLLPRSSGARPPLPLP
jgi:lipopolysaccharide export system protein LptA